MKSLMIAIIALSSLHSVAQAGSEPKARMIGVEADGYTQCELHLNQDFIQDRERYGFTLSDAAVQNSLTNFTPRSFSAYIRNDGHNYIVSIGHRTLQLKFSGRLDEDIDLIGYTYNQNGETLECDLSDAELIFNGF